MRKWDFLVLIIFKNSTVSKDEINYMINMDMVGRLNEENKLSVSGVGSAKIFKQIVNSNNSNFNLVEFDHQVHQALVHQIMRPFIMKIFLFLVFSPVSMKITINRQMIMTKLILKELN